MSDLNQDASTQSGGTAQNISGDVRDSGSRVNIYAPPASDPSGAWARHAMGELGKQIASNAKQNTMVLTEVARLSTRVDEVCRVSKALNDVLDKLNIMEHKVDNGNYQTDRNTQVLTTLTWIVALLSIAVMTLIAHHYGVVVIP